MAERMEQYRILKALKEKVKHHANAYDTDIFPDYTLKENPSPSVDAISAKMGRHMCDCFLVYIDEAFAEIQREIKQSNGL